MLSGLADGNMSSLINILTKFGIAVTDGSWCWLLCSNPIVALYVDRQIIPLQPWIMNQHFREGKEMLS